LKFPKRIIFAIFSVISFKKRYKQMWPFIGIMPTVWYT